MVSWGSKSIGSSPLQTVRSRRFEFFRAEHLFLAGEGSCVLRLSKSCIVVWLRGLSQFAGAAPIFARQVSLLGAGWLWESFEPAYINILVPWSGKIWWCFGIESRANSNHTRLNCSSLPWPWSWKWKTQIVTRVVFDCKRSAIREMQNASCSSVTIQVT